ncbi:MAG: flagellar protein FlaG [Pseudomonas sp.]
MNIAPASSLLAVASGMPGDNRANNSTGQAGLPVSAQAGAVPTLAATALAALNPALAEDKTSARAPLEQAVSSMQTFVQTISRDLNFSLDDSAGRMVVKVTDGATGELIRQMPTEEALRLAESLDSVRSLLFKAEA